MTVKSLCFFFLTHDGYESLELDCVSRVFGIFDNSIVASHSHNFYDAVRKGLQSSHLRANCTHHYMKSQTYANFALIEMV